MAGGRNDDLKVFRSVLNAPIRNDMKFDDDREDSSFVSVRSGWNNQIINNFNFFIGIRNRREKERKDRKIGKMASNEWRIQRWEMERFKD